MIHIFTLTWNGLPLLSELYPSLVQSLKGLPYLWHVKDNGSKDGTVDAVKTWAKFDPSIRVYEYPDNNLNFAEGMNWLYQQSSPEPEDLILLLNNDVIFQDCTSIQSMVDAMTPDVGVVGARLLFTGSDRLQHAGVVFESNSRMPMHFRANEPSDKDAEANRYFQAVTGAVLLTKAKYYADVCRTNKSGRLGMDEIFRWAFEDIDLCLAVAANHNKKVVYCGRTNIFHGESVSLKKNPVNKLFMTPNVNHFKTKWLNKYSIDIFNYASDKNYKVIK